MSGFILSLEIPRGQNFPSPFLCPCLSHFWSNPVLELFCWWKLAAEDERVEAGFVDDNCFFILISIKNHHFTPIFFINMAVNISTTVLVPEGISYILTYEPWLSWDLYCPNSAELWVSEYCWGFCGWIYFWKYKGCPIWWPLARLQIWWHGKIFYPQLEVILSLSKKRWESAY